MPRIDRKIVKQRDAINRLISFHAESETLNEDDSSAFEDLKDRLKTLEAQRERLLLTEEVWGPGRRDPHHKRFSPHSNEPVRTKQGF
ncbi:MAG: hypothetical protein ABR507_03310 [Actinomycetota bacterium]|nr:hypothetical protein [Actinomycetota bacterium]